MHSRRRYQGVAAIINQRLGAEQYAAAASSYLAEKEAALREQCVVFQEKLQEFAAEHQHEIENNTALRARFLELCMNMGVEPFMSRRSVWSQLLGLGEWYARLGFLVAQIALATRDWNGGVIRLTTLRRALQRRLDVDTGSHEAQSKRSRQVSTEDIVRAVQTLDTLQAGFRILVVDDKKHDRYLVSGAASQVSFTADEKAVLQRARETGGQVSREDFSWEQLRWEQCLERMLELGILWVDDGAPDNRRRYWALGMISEPAEAPTGTSSVPVDFSSQ
ncbi:hypothetical protein CCYA_CCYA04G1387 [Cyanidiococcus yangmingshanensis]|nr:hypothetical protein CCYA_CCYA04G1387 [Cyanidiococcus yangmingshanensis]